MTLWLYFDDVVADTGADITLISKKLGEGVVNDIFAGAKASIKSVTPYELDVYVHNLRLRVIVLNNILIRAKAIDLLENYENKITHAYSICHSNQRLRWHTGYIRP